MQRQSTKTGDAEFWPLSGNPYFYVVIDKPQRFQVNIPQELSAKLPATTIPAKIFYRDKVWDLPCAGDQASKKFGIEEWGKFMTENDVKLGDACLFELMEGDSKSRVKFKVQILKDDFPLDLLEKADGFSMNNPIDID
ncbi:putative transcription factor B3-Domain family [Helianthus anomalus]